MLLLRGRHQLIVCERRLPFLELDPGVGRSKFILNLFVVRESFLRGMLERVVQLLLLELIESLRVSDLFREERQVVGHLSQVLHVEGFGFCVSIHIILSEFFLDLLLLGY